jgi:hypothetical protein
MKVWKIGFIALSVLILTLGFSAASYAFHSGGVANCQGCHTMHNSLGGAAMSPAAQFTGYPYLLKGSDQSSTCLNCHSAGNPTGYRVMTYPVPAPGSPPLSRTPGGDFAYLGKTYTWVPRPGASLQTSHGERHGHNVVATDYGLDFDGTLVLGPGGGYPASGLGCHSCHDPHGRTRITLNDGIVTPEIGAAVPPISASGSYGALPTANSAVGVYRLLGGAGYEPKSVPGHPFVNDSPIAVAPSTYNRTEAATDTRVAYGQGMSEWCANCHGLIHNDSLANEFIHPASNQAKLTAEIVANYNAYVKSGDLTGSEETSYTSLVPYEEGTDDRTFLAGRAVNDGSVKTGPSGGDENVMCLSCHRTHASAWDSIGRWNFKTDFITYGGAYPDPTANPAYAQGRTQLETEKAYYDRPATNFAYYQRSLCNKCHVKD